MASLEEIRAKLRAKSEQNQNNRNNSGQRQPNAVYPFWDAPDDSTTVVRFLPDGDGDNKFNEGFFWVNRLMIKLPFQGIKGQNDKPVTVDVPCMKMYGKTCPIIEETKPWWKDEDLKDTARTYYFNKSAIFQGFVKTGTLKEGKEDIAPENPIRRFVINPTLLTIIKSSILDPDIEYLPTDYDNGLDFRITKTANGQYSDYKTSSWARKTTSLNDEQRAAIATHGLFDLKSFLPKEPDDETVQVIFMMFKDSLDGLAYDPDKYAEYYKPFGLQTGNSNGGNSNTESAPQSSVRPSASKDALAALKTRVQESAKDEEPEVEETPAAPKVATSTDVAETLAKIRSRMGAKK